MAGLILFLFKKQNYLNNKDLLIRHPHLYKLIIFIIIIIFPRQNSIHLFPPTHVTSTYSEAYTKPTTLTVTKKVVCEVMFYECSCQQFCLLLFRFYLIHFFKDYICLHLNYSFGSRTISPRLGDL